MDDLSQIKEKINIVDLIQEYLPLKKSGVNFKTNCPFHQEKTASFMVSPDRGIWRCFGCSKGGDIFKFLMEKEGLDFKEALEILAKKAGISLKRPSSESNLRDRLLEINLKAAEFFHFLLTQHKLGKNALDYLKGRGLTIDTIKEFNLGYSPNSWDSLTNFLLKRGFKTSEIIQSGLGVASKSGCYDRFRGRVIFPLVDSKNQVISFAGRILDKGEPKYLNGPQTPIFDKSNFLFGLNLAKAEIRKKDQAILTEGELDMILSYQSGVKNVVACKGTALTLGQVDLIKKYAETVILCFDMDLAGDSASRRGIEIADSAGLNIKVIQIPDGKDPAELILKDPKIWEEAVEKAEPIYDYYLKSASSRYKTNQAEDKKKMAQELIPIWAKIADPVTADFYLQKLSAMLSVSEDVLKKEIARFKSAPSGSYKNILSEDTAVKKGVKDRRELLEEYLLSLLLKMPFETVYVPSFPETIFQKEVHRSIYVLLVLYLDTISFKGKSFRITDFVKSLPEELVVTIDELYLVEIEQKLESADPWKVEVETVVAQLKRILIKASLEKLSAQIKNAQVFGELEQLNTLNRRFRDLSVKLRSFK